MIRVADVKFASTNGSIAMRWLNWIREHVGAIATVTAAALVFVGATVPFYFHSLFGIPTFGPPGVLAIALVAASLVDRFRPSRWLLLTTLPPMWLLPVLMGMSEEYRVAIFFQSACATAAWLLLLSPPVRRHFALGHGRIERFLTAAGLHDRDRFQEFPGISRPLPSGKVDTAATAGTVGREQQMLEIPASVGRSA